MFIWRWLCIATCRRVWKFGKIILYSTPSINRPLPASQQSRDQYRHITADQPVCACVYILTTVSSNKRCCGLWGGVRLCCADRWGINKETISTATSAVDSRIASQSFRATLTILWYCVSVQICESQKEHCVAAFVKWL